MRKDKRKFIIVLDRELEAAPNNIDLKNSYRIMKEFVYGKPFDGPIKSGNDRHLIQMKETLLHGSQPYNIILLVTLSHDEDWFSK